MGGAFLEFSSPISLHPLHFSITQVNDLIKRARARRDSRRVDRTHYTTTDPDPGGWRAARASFHDTMSMTIMTSHHTRTSHETNTRTCRHERRRAHTQAHTSARQTNQPRRTDTRSPPQTITRDSCVSRAPLIPKRGHHPPWLVRDQKAQMPLHLQVLQCHDRWVAALRSSCCHCSHVDPTPARRALCAPEFECPSRVVWASRCSCLDASHCSDARSWISGRTEPQSGSEARFLVEPTAGRPGPRRYWRGARKV